MPAKDHKTPKKSEVLKPPKIVNSPKEFASIWNAPQKEEEILNGNAEIPNMYRRQNRLVGQVIDACIVLHVYEEMKEKHSYNSLRFFLPDEKFFKQEDFDKLAAMAIEEKESRKPGEPSKVLPILVEMLTKEKNSKKQLKNHKNLCDKEQWKNYQSQFREYVWQSINREDKIAESHGGHTAVSLPAFEMPEDPRITAIKGEVGATIKILNCGPKKLDAIEEKKERKISDASTLRDIVRIGVLPKKREFAQDFIEAMGLLNPIKKLDKEGHTISRVYESEPEVRGNGYYDQKFFVAQDRCNDPEKVTKGNVGTIAEIKILPSAMHDSESLTAITRKVLKKFDNPNLQYTSDNPDDERLTTNRRRLERVYNEQKEAFATLTQKIGVNYEWPAFNLQSMSKKELNDPKTYQELEHALIALDIKIHVDAISDENNTWKKEYLRTAVKREVDMEPKKKEKPGSKLPPDISDKPINKEEKSWMQKIADSGIINLEQIREEIAAEIELEKKHKHAQAHR